MVAALVYRISIEACRQQAEHLQMEAFQLEALFRQVSTARQQVWQPEKAVSVIEIQACVQACQTVLQAVAKAKKTGSTKARTSAEESVQGIVWQGVQQYALDTLANITLHTRHYSVLQQVLQQHPSPYWQGKLALLQGKFGTAHKHWQKLAPTPQHHPHWEETLLTVVQQELSHWPHYLHLRNRLEEVVQELYHTQQPEPLDALLRYLEAFAQINGEVYKLVGRAFLYCGVWSLSLQLLHKALQHQPFDAETYYHLGEWYVANRQWVQAKRCLQQTLMIYPSYSPAQWLLASVEKETRHAIIARPNGLGVVRLEQSQG